MTRRRSLVGVVVLLVVSALLTAALVVVFGNVQIRDTRTYRARFTDVSQLKKGEDVRAAGVTVGQVSGVSLQSDHTVLVSFSVDKDLLGDRFLELAAGTSAGTPLASEQVIPASQTKPALDLDALYASFTPLTQGLDPSEVNQLSSSLVQVLQGEAGSIQNLFDTVGSLTGTLAQHDQLIGQVITNLNSVLGKVNAHGGDLSATLDQLQQTVSGLSQDRDAIAGSLTDVSALAGNVSGLLETIRPDLRTTVTQTGRLATLLNQYQGLIQQDLTEAPPLYQVISRAGAYGSQFQFYLCGIQLAFGTSSSKPVTTTDIFQSEEKRCQK